MICFTETTATEYNATPEIHCGRGEVTNPGYRNGQYFLFSANC
jgi:hypothetical protein